MNAAVKFFIYLGLIGLILYTGGCFDRPAKKTNSAVPETITLERTEATLATTETLPTVTDFVDKTTVVMYFVNEEGELVAEQREIPSVIGIARETIRELLLGPKNEMLSPTIPTGTELLDIDVSDGLCTVDFSKELIAGHSGGSGSEYLTVYSIVNTLTQFGTIEEVQIRVEGKIVDTIAGHVAVDAPLTRDDEIISTMSPLDSDS